jgi:hypothetical protein
MRKSFCYAKVRHKKNSLKIFEIASVLVRFDHIARVIVNANHDQRATAELRAVDLLCVVQKC